MIFHVLRDPTYSEETRLPFWHREIPLHYAHFHIAHDQADERLLWRDAPKLKHMRKPLRAVDIFLLIPLSLVFALLLLLAIHIWSKQQLSLSENIDMFLIFWAVLFLLLALSNWLRTFTGALRTVPPYRKYTLYALTNRRALIILSFPGREPVVLAYAPWEIKQPTSILRSDGSGTVMFGAPRQLKLYRPWLTFTLPGSFIGISNVQHVIDLLLRLKEQHGTDMD